MPSSHLILWRPLFLLPPIPPSIRVFSNESTLHIRWPKYWSFSFSIIPSKEHPGLISFRMDWLDRLSVPGTLKSLLQHHSSKASILQRSAFFPVQLSHPYMTWNLTYLICICTHDHLGTLSYLSVYSLELYIQMVISFLCSFAFCFSSFSAIPKASLDNHFAFFHFFFSWIILITTSCTMFRTSIHSFSGTLSDLIL